MKALLTRNPTWRHGGDRRASTEGKLWFGWKKIEKEKSEEIDGRKMLLLATALFEPFARIAFLGRFFEWMASVGFKNRCAHGD